MPQSLISDMERKIILWLQDLGMSQDVSEIVFRVAVIIAIVAVAFIIDKICRKAFVKWMRKVVARTEYKWDDYIFNYEVLNNICKLILPIIIYSMIPLALPDGGLLDFVLRLCKIYIIAMSVKLICSFISGFYSMTSENESTKNHSLKAFYQMIKLVVICIGVIIGISTLIDKDPVAILTGLGAGTAILMLVFQDTIKGFVAGIQLMANDMLRPGDWITVPKYGADGDVIEVTLTTVKVRNWDKTIVTVPPYALVNDSFQNWRGMYDIGGRRVKRSINIDMNTVRFCSDEEMEKFRQHPWMEGFEASGKEEVNLYVFRHYVEYYLKHHPKVSQELTMTVRQLQPTAQGMPIELYFFSSDTRWLKYEHLQAEVFDHILAMLPVFGLKVFQSPTGQDFQVLS